MILQLKMVLMEVRCLGAGGGGFIVFYAEKIS